MRGRPGSGQDKGSQLLSEDLSAIDAVAARLWFPDGATAWRNGCLCRLV
jgi:hypothetical protein